MYGTLSTLRIMLAQIRLHMCESYRIISRLLPNGFLDRNTRTQFVIWYSNCSTYILKGRYHNLAHLCTLLTQQKPITLRKAPFLFRMLLISSHTSCLSMRSTQFHHYY